MQYSKNLHVFSYFHWNLYNLSDCLHNKHIDSVYQAHLSLLDKYPLLRILHLLDYNTSHSDNKVLSSDHSFIGFCLDQAVLPVMIDSTRITNLILCFVIAIDRCLSKVCILVCCISTSIFFYKTCGTSLDIFMIQQVYRSDVPPRRNCK